MKESDLERAVLYFNREHNHLATIEGGVFDLLTVDGDHFTVSVAGKSKIIMAILSFYGGEE